ncbi:hypothetical protein M422DRAFT_72720 [Sphaerobolus stellatus SS14]|uniref:Uncharacterized protein n=1 Tax=Sphaerobolus stellatus (strain SS14) TaxID=990650 RepID=A0A0C9U0Q5_SPHS4|nr:hypothetical protein M422DRAFT_72720 [Sphaerobolus stellatus SS14]
MKLSQVRKRVQAAAKRKGPILTDPRAVKSMKISNGREVAWEEIPEELATPTTPATSSSSNNAPQTRTIKAVGGVNSPLQSGEFFRMDYGAFLGVEDMGEYDGGDIREKDNGNEEEPEPDSDVKDTDGNKTVERDRIDHTVTLRELALTAMDEQEVPPISKPSCFGIDCSAVRVYDCVYCDAMGYYCQECIIERHQHLPFHRIKE